MPQQQMPPACNADLRWSAAAICVAVPDLEHLLKYHTAPKRMPCLRPISLSFHGAWVNFG